jgi:hypothetical protein
VGSSTTEARVRGGIPLPCEAPEDAVEAREAGLRSKDVVFVPLGNLWGDHAYEASPDQTLEGAAHARVAQGELLAPADDVDLLEGDSAEPSPVAVLASVGLHVSQDSESDCDGFPIAGEPLAQCAIVGFPQLALWALARSRRVGSIGVCHDVARVEDHLSGVAPVVMRSGWTKSVDPCFDAHLGVRLGEMVPPTA